MDRLSTMVSAATVNLMAELQPYWIPEDVGTEVTTTNDPEKVADGIRQMLALLDDPMGFSPQDVCWHIVYDCAHYYDLRRKDVLAVVSRHVADLNKRLGA